MAKDKGVGKWQWKRLAKVTVALLPLIFGIVVASYTQLFSIVSQRRAVECCIGEAVEHINATMLGEDVLSFNGARVRSIYSYRIKVLNSGGKAIEKQRIRVGFEAGENPFEILSTHHTTRPAMDFGEIRVSRDSVKDICFEYALLNPGDEDLITLLTNGKADIDVTGKHKDVRFRCIRQDSERKNMRYSRLVRPEWAFFKVVSVVVALLSFCFFFFLVRSCYIVTFAPDAGAGTPGRASAITHSLPKYTSAGVR